MFEVGGADTPVWGPWGKAGDADEPHPLICHAIDTAAVAELLYDVLLGPQVRHALETAFSGLGDARSWVAVLCGLHDIGKCSPIFQAKRDDIASRYLSDEFNHLVSKAVAGHNDPEVRALHGTLTAVHLRQFLDERGASTVLRDALAYGLGGHHGSLLSANEVQKASRRRLHHGGEAWYQLRCELAHVVADLWELDDPLQAAWQSAHLDVPGAVGLAGLASVSDWIASDPTNFGYAHLPLNDLPAYLHQAREQAATAVNETLRWQQWNPPADTSYRGVFAEEARPLQEAVEEVVTHRDDPGEPGVLVIEAPTGEGKTRAGFQAAATLVRQLGLSGMYFALPTKATAAQVHAELGGAAQGLGLPSLPNLVQAGPPPVSPSCVDEDGGTRDGHEWFTRKRGLLFPVGVGTIDQALQAVIRSRHVFVRLTGLSGKVLVLDEVHDVDAHMTTLLRRLMWWCGRFGTPVVLMSATLPSGHREQLIAHWRAGRHGLAVGKVEPQAAEPGGQRITWAGAHNTLPPRTFASSGINTKRPAIALHHLGDDELVSWLFERVGSSGCALVIRNLVRDAERTHDALTRATRDWEHPPNLIFLTGRTPKGKRTKIERTLREDFGPEAEVRPNTIVIGTQVLQHSLDVDFDLLASDLAPINELIQRIGRIHRHDRTKRANPVPEFALLHPPEGKDGPRFARGLHTVYHTALLLRTRKVLQGRSELNLASESAELVHEVYGTSAQPEEQLSRRAQQAELSMSRQDKNDESRVRRFYLPALVSGDSLRNLTYQPTAASRTRKDTPWKERT